MANLTAEKIEFGSGYFYVTDEHGHRTAVPIADMLRAADIPVLTYEQVAQISTLANLVAVLVRTLIDNGTLGESFLEDGDYDLDDLIEVIGDLGGDYGEPDLST